MMRRTAMEAARQNRMGGKRGEDFPGHMRGEIKDLPGPHAHPFGMAAGQAKRYLLFRQAIQNTEDLRFLPAHHFRQAISIARLQPRHQAHTCGRERHGQSRAGDFCHAGRTGQIRRFRPALLATGHAGNHHKLFASFQPILGDFAQFIRKAAGLHGQNARFAFALVQHRPGLIQPIGAQRCGAPIQPDHAGCPLSMVQSCRRKLNDWSG